MAKAKRARMEFLQLALKHTPEWVYIVFFLLIWHGVKASKDRVVPLWKMVVPAILFPVFSLYTVMVALPATTLVFVGWTASLLVGAVVAALVIHNTEVTVDQEKKLLLMPGTWRTLALILIIFGSRYYTAYAAALDPELLRQTFDKLIVLALSGFCSGFFIGKLVRAYMKLQAGPHVVLEIPKKREK